MIYEPNTKAVQSIIDRISVLTEDEVNRLSASSEANWDSALAETWNAAYKAAYNAAYNAAPDWDAVKDATYNAIINAAWYAAWYAAKDAILATVTYDLATLDGPYTIAQRDLLLAPWVSVCGMPEALITT